MTTLRRFMRLALRPGRALAIIRQMAARLDRLEEVAEDAAAQRRQLAAELADLRGALTAIERAHLSGDAVLAQALGDLTRRLDTLLLHRAGLGLGMPAEAAQARRAGEAETGEAGAGEAETVPAAEGFEVFLASFYHRLENRWRGAPEEIARRLRVYLPEVEAAVRRTGNRPVMDLGCGRGEWLGLLREAGIAAFGVDTNPQQIDAAHRQGLDVRPADAVAALAGAEDASLAVITAHHLVEHLPFETVAWITREAMRVLAPGGLLIYETPNTRNLLVGATTFHTDPTHLKPMPEQVLGVLFETAGFDPVEIRHLNPHERLEEFLARPGVDPELAQLMFGPQDLAVLGMRPPES